MRQNLIPFFQQDGLNKNLVDLAIKKYQAKLAMVEVLEAEKKLDDKMKQEIINKSEGNFLYLEQALKAGFSLKKMLHL